MTERRDIEILSTGALNSVQDHGRPGYLDAGIGRGGTMDRPALTLANRMLGNADDAAGIEIALFPFRLRFHAPTAFAVTGADCEVKLADRVLPSWWAAVAQAGETLTIGIPRRGARALLAFAGGIDVPVVIGARATDLKSGFGGLDGRGLLRGDRLPLGEAPPIGRRLAEGFGIDPVPLRGFWPATGAPLRLRVLPAAEYEAFGPAERQALVEADWTVTPDANRMGYRLSGPELKPARPIELFSHGIMPGVVQVPPGGQPIIQLAEANTCGGYPKIATIIEGDLWRLAQAPVGTRLRFEVVERDAAIAALKAERDGLDRIGRALKLM